MASTTALFTGLSGLNAHARRLDVIGNNIANVNTTAYKSNRLQFAPLMSRSFSLGTAPTNSTGGTNPGQIGLGVGISGTQRNFQDGAISATGVPTDLALEGPGFFLLDRNGEQVYTRDGAFQRNEANELVNIAGGRVQGYTVDDAFEIVEGQLVDLTIPVGVMTIAEATRNVNFEGNLNASGTIATTGSVHTSRAFHTDVSLAGGTEADGSEDLTAGGNDLFIADSLGNGTMAIEGGAGTIITISGIEKGGKDLGTHTFQFADPPTETVDGSGTSLNDFTAFLEQVLGLHDDSIAGESLGGSIAINAAGQIVVTGNEGTVQDLDLESADLVATNYGAGSAQPFVFSETGVADGESVRTSYTVYDSLGTPVTVDLSFVLQDTTPAEGSTWTFIAESNDHAAVDRLVGLGTVTFDADGLFVSASNETISIDRDNGAVSPLSINLEFGSGSESITALTSQTSEFAAVYQDGSPIGTLSSFSIGEDGTIAGSFSNGLTRSVGQVAIATFTNPEGLIDAGNNEFRVGPNSGDPLVTTPLEFGGGRVISGALELSNVDLSKEFIDMILTQTGYSASSRVISTTDELMDQLLLLGR